MAGHSGDTLSAGFREVFKYLSSSSCSIADDAILHILVDVLAKRLNDDDEDTFILQSGITGFLDHNCLTSDSTDASIIVTALKISSLLSATEKKHEKWAPIIKKCHGKIWETRDAAGASVTTALYDCLRTATQHSLGLEWIISEYKECIEEAFILIESGSSVFLEKSVCAFLSDFMLTPVRCNESLSEDLKGMHQQIVNKTLLALHRHCLESDAEYTVQKTRSAMRNLLRLTESICLCDNTVIDKLLHSQDFITDIHKVAYISSGPEYEMCLKIISALLQKCVNVDVMKLAEHLWEEGDITKTLKLVTKVYTSSRDIVTSDTCHSVLTAFLLFVLREEKDNVWMDSLRTSRFSKTQMTHVLSTTLSCLSQCKMNEMDAVLKVLKASLGSANLSFTTSLPNLENNRKLQRCCLQYCLDVKDMVGDSDLEQLTRCAINIMKELDMDTVTYTMCMKCLHSNLPWLTNSTAVRSLSAGLANLIKRQLCSLKWELRDTTIEFIGNAAKEYKDEASVTQWLKVNYLHQQVWQCVQDGDSYVRASAISTIGHLLSCPTVWQSLLLCLDITGESLLDQVISVLESDTEAFARRSAAEFLVKFYKASTLTVSSLTPFVKALSDFDWEVKLCALCFVDSIVQDHLDTKCTSKQTDVPDYAKELLQERKRDSGNTVGENIRSVYSLYSMGCLTGIMKCLDDFDEKVCIKAVESIEQCRHKLKSIFADHLCKREGFESLCEDVLSICDNELLDTTSEGTEPASKRFKPDSVLSDNCIDMDKDNDKGIDDRKMEMKTTVKDFIAIIQSIINFDVASHLAKFESQTDYYLNPWSLIQDILSYSSRDEEENLVDCY